MGRGLFSGQNTSLSTVIWLADQMFPWNLALLWSLVRRLRGAREDWSGRFLHAWWISIFGFFAIAALTRAVYLLPMYPAIALLAARAIGSMIPSLGKTCGFRSLEKVPSASIRTPSSAGIVKRFGVAIVLFDLTLMLVNPAFWRDTRLRDARLAFIEKIAAIVSSDSPLFVTPEFDNTDTLVIAYRLGRQIDRKSITCANRNDYFLLPRDPKDSTEVETRVLASSSVKKMVLVTVISQARSLTHNLDCKKNRPSPLATETMNAPIDR